MLQKYTITFVALLFLAQLGFTPAEADETTRVCTQLKKKASGDMLKYSLDAVVNNPVFFDDIRCGVRYRKELCAIEMVNFDISARVYDFYTAEKIELDKAYFWLSEKNKDAPIQAFSSKESAEKYGLEQEDGVILDYPGLSDRLFK